MTFSRWSSRLVLASVLALGCGDSRKSSTPRKDAGPQAHVSPHHAYEPPQQRAARSNGVARVVRVETSSQENVAFRVGTAIEAGSILSTGNARIALELKDGARIELEPASRASVGTSSSIVLVSGSAHCVVAPVGNAMGMPLRIATPLATVAVDGSADVLVATFRDGSTWLAVLQGRVRVLKGEADERGKPASDAYVAGQAVWVKETRTRPSAAPPRLEAAREQVITYTRGAKVGDASRAERRYRESVEALDQAAQRVQEELARGAEATEAHRAAVRVRDREKTWELQRALVAHAQALTRSREVLLVRWERVLAQGLSSDPQEDGNLPGPIRERSARITQLLGR